MCGNGSRGGEGGRGRRNCGEKVDVHFAVEDLHEMSNDIFNEFLVREKVGVSGDELNDEVGV